MKSLLIIVNLGEFGNDEERPSMLEIQHEVNAVFYTNNMNFLYNRIEVNNSTSCSVKLFFHYESINDIIELTKDEIDSKVKNLEKSLPYKVVYYIQNEEESNLFIPLIDDSETGELSPMQIEQLNRL